MNSSYRNTLNSFFLCLLFIGVCIACDLLPSGTSSEEPVITDINTGGIFNKNGLATTSLYGRTSTTFSKQVEQGVAPKVEGSLQFSTGDINEWEIVGQSNIGYFPEYSEERSFEQFRLHLAFKDNSIPQTANIIDANLILRLREPLKANNEATVFRPGLIQIVAGVQTQVPLTAKESFQNSGVALPVLKLLISDDNVSSELTINIAEHASFMQAIQNSLVGSHFLTLGIRSSSENSQGALVNLESISLVLSYDAKPTFVNLKLPNTDALIPTLGNEGVSFEWSQSRGSPPITYTIELDTVQSFEQPILSFNLNQSTEFLFSGNDLPKGKRSYWRIVSKNQFGENTSRNIPLRVRPIPPENVIPSTMEVQTFAGVAARLDWDPVPGINMYLIKIESGNPLVLPRFSVVQDTFYLGGGPVRLGGSDFILSVASMIETQDWRSDFVGNFGFTSNSQDLQ